MGDKLSTQSFLLGKKCFQSVVIISVILLLTNIKIHQKTSNILFRKTKSRELYNLQLMLNLEKPTAQTYFEKKNSKP